MITELENNIFEYKVNLEKIELTDFKGFDNIEIPFHRGMNVLISPNGGGKTTILKGLLIFLNHIVNYSIQRNESYIQESNVDDIKIERTAALGKAFFKIAYKEISFPEEAGKFEEEQYTEETEEVAEYTEEEAEYTEEEELITDGIAILNFSISLEDNKILVQEQEESTSKIIINEQEDTQVYFDEFGESISAYLEVKTWIPVFVYYGNETLDYTWSVNENLFFDRKNRLEKIYQSCLDHNRYKYESFFHWFERMQKVIIQQENPKKLLVNSFIQNFEEKKRGFELVKKAILGILNLTIGELENRFENLRIQSSEEGDRLLVDKNGKSLDVRQLSAGEKSIFSIVSDLARRMFLANPINDLNIDNPLHGNGIVLIDEIDMHLHVNHQWSIISKLEKYFPNIQFIITTHSPYIVQAVKSQNRKIISNGQLIIKEKWNSDSGESINLILSSYFNSDFKFSNKETEQMEKLRFMIKEVLVEKKSQHSPELKKLVKQLIGNSVWMKRIVAYELLLMERKLGKN